MTEPSNEDALRGRANAVEAALSRRARVALRSLRVGADARCARSAGPPGRALAESGRPPAPGRAHPGEGLLASLRHHLLAGETHYPDRPGMVELRRRVGAALPGAGFPARDADCVLITQGEGESLFVTLLGLGRGEGTSIVGKAGGRHRRLLEWMRVRVAEPGADAATEAGAAFRLIEHDAGARIPEIGNPSGRTDSSVARATAAPQARGSGSSLARAAGDRLTSVSHEPLDSPRPRAAGDPELLQVHAIGDRLFASAGGRSSSSGPGDSSAPVSPAPPGGEGPGARAAGPGGRASTESARGLSDAVVIGSLDGIEGMHPFSLGFVAAPAQVRALIAKWKQASSICSPAPSQRAALWALGVRP